MLAMIWDTRSYFFWLLMISLLCWGRERLAPWRPQQRALRRGFGQDCFWLVFNGHYAGVLIATITAWCLAHAAQVIGGWPWPATEQVQLFRTHPLWLQFIVLLVIKDLLEWCIHVMLHRVPWLWEFHKLHHSIVELDWIGNFRFHWMEIVIYRGLTYLPLVLLGIDNQVILWVAVVGTLIGHINHANLDFGWGPLFKLINSPRFHVWHHDVVVHGRGGQNFAIIFSIWDWLFATAYRAPTPQPAHLGFLGMERFPQGLAGRLLYPFWRRSPKEKEDPGPDSPDQDVSRDDSAA